MGKGIQAPLPLEYQNNPLYQKTNSTNITPRESLSGKERKKERKKEVEEEENSTLRPGCNP